jgi:hypothetical protein
MASIRNVTNFLAHKSITEIVALNIYPLTTAVNASFYKAVDYVCLSGYSPIAWQVLTIKS